MVENNSKVVTSSNEGWVAVTDHDEQGTGGWMSLYLLNTAAMEKVEDLADHNQYKAIEQTKVLATKKITFRFDVMLSASGD